MASSTPALHVSQSTPSTAPTISSTSSNSNNANRLPPLAPSANTTNTTAQAQNNPSDTSNGTRRPSLFGFFTGRRSSATNNNNNNASQSTNSNDTTATQTASVTAASATSSTAAVGAPAPGTGASAASATSTGGAPSIAQRRASATAAFSQRRNSAINVALRESRANDERPETNRHQKRPSTTGSDIVEAIRNDLQEIPVFDDLSFNMLTPLALDTSVPSTTSTTAATVTTTTTTTNTPSATANAVSTPTRVNTNGATTTSTNSANNRSTTPTNNSNAATATSTTPHSNTNVAGANTTPATTAQATTPANNNGTTNTTNRNATTTPATATATTTTNTPNTTTNNGSTRAQTAPTTQQAASNTSTDATTNRKGREENHANEANTTKPNVDPMRPDIQLTVPSVKQFPQLTKALKSGDKEQELRAVISFRMILSKSYAAPIQEVVDCGVVPHFVKCLSRDGEDRLQLEASWALTNIASGTTEHTLLVIQAGALPPLLRLIKSPNREIREQAVWGIGNIAGDSPRTRDTVLREGAVKHLVPQLYLELDRKDNKSMSLLRNMVWATANLCRGKPPPPFEQVRPLLAPLKRVLELNDNEVLADACWALNYLSDTNEHIQEVIQSGVCPRLIQLLGHSEHVVKTPALRAVGNIVTGDNDQTQHMLDLNVIDALKPLLSDPRRTIRGETCWTISNITAGSYTQIQHVMDKEVFPILVNCAMDTESNVAKEAIWAISNATSGGTSEQVVKIASYGCIPALVSALSSFHEMDNRIIMVALEGIENFLVAGDTTEEQQNPFISVVRGCGGLDLLKNDLSNHANDAIREKATDIVTKYLSAPEPSSVKPPPEMWTPAEVADAKKREEEMREKYRDQAGMLSDQLNQDRKGKPPRRGSSYIPPQFYCPISQEIMVDPVSTVDGHVYDRENISRWFASGNFTSPVTGAKLKSTQLTPNHPLRQMIESFMPGYTHRADLDKEWSCIACTSLNNPVEVKCNVCGAERPLMKNQDPDSTPGIYLAVDKKNAPKNDESKEP